VKAVPSALPATFTGTSFSTPLGGTTRFSERSGTLEVTTPTPGGKSGTFPIVYAAGVFPLQQYVVATERGKLQSLGVAWDSRNKDAGGERWFHVYGSRGIAHGDSLFFTEPAQSWNHVCADCHSTFLERRYDPKSDSFDTRWAELSIGCEACHGPGAEHVRLANMPRQSKASVGALAVSLRTAAPWGPSATGSPSPRPPESVEIEVCAPCHSRREPLREGFVAGDPFLDAFEPELLRPGRYHADGQVEGEVYEWGSFRQSKMFASGVRCSDCHEPHAGTLRAGGNALCSRCHLEARFDQESHTHHSGPKAPLCIDCHMPPSTFMQIDERRDHSIRIPRPDLSVEFGVPNACTHCHKKESASWARDQVARWSPGAAARPHFARALLGERKGSLAAPRELAALAQDPRAPDILRATALERLGRYRTRTALAALKSALESPEPLVAFGAVRGAAALPLAERVPLLVPMTAHRSLAVRIEAGKALAAPLGDLDATRRAAVERAFEEVEQSFAVGASRPETHVERSSFELARGKIAEAEAALQTALRLAPCLVEAHLNLADLARHRGDEGAAERALRSALTCDPANAAAHHALGLWQVRTGDKRGAVTNLRKAVELAPTNARFALVLAVALADGGDPPGAVTVLDAALERHPNDPELLQTLAGFLQRAGDAERAGKIGEQLRVLLGE